MGHCSVLVSCNSASACLSLQFGGGSSLPYDLSSPVGQRRVVQFAQLSTCYNGGMSSKFLVCWTGNWKSYAFEIHPYYIVYLIYFAQWHFVL